MPATLIWRTTTDEDPAEPGAPADPPRRNPARGRAAGARHDADRAGGSAGREPPDGERAGTRKAPPDARHGSALGGAAAHDARELAADAGGLDAVGGPARRGRRQREAAARQAPGGAGLRGRDMGLRFFRRIRIAPGVTLNLSKSGVSTSIG